MFGQNVVHHGPGSLRVGDAVERSSRAPERSSVERRRAFENVRAHTAKLTACTSLPGRRRPALQAEGRRPGRHNGRTDQEQAKAAARPGHEALMAELQEKLYAQDRWAVLLIFQAMDAAGKDGTIKHVMSGVNPQGCQVYSFKAPSREELDHDFLWRCAPPRCPSAAASASSTARTTRRCWSCACTRRSSRAQQLPPRARHQAASGRSASRTSRSFERYLARNGVRGPQVLPARLARRSSASASSSGSTSRRRTGSSRSATCASAQHWDEYMRAYEDVIRAHRDRARAVVRRPRRPQVVHAHRGGRASSSTRSRSSKLDYPSVSPATRRKLAARAAICSPSRRPNSAQAGRAGNREAPAETPTFLEVSGGGKVTCRCLIRGLTCECCTLPRAGASGARLG